MDIDQGTDARNGVIAFHCDATPETGLGHVMRCLALAQEAHERGFKPRFVGKYTKDGIREMLRREGFPCSRYFDFRYVGWAVFDGYDFTQLDFDIAKDRGCKVLVIDDNNILPEYDVDILLNYNIYANELEYNTGKNTRELLGIYYTPLRNEVLHTSKPRHLLVTVEDEDIIEKIFSCTNKIKRLMVRRTRDFDFMWQAFEWAHCAIAAGGVTAYELIHHNIPFLVCALSGDQKNNTRYLAMRGLALSFGRNTPVEELTKYISILISNCWDDMADGRKHVLDAMQNIQCK